MPISELSPCTFLEEEDKALVQLARTYTERGSKVAWSEVAKKMRRWRRSSVQLAQRLNALKRTFGRNLTSFPPSFLLRSSSARSS
ncbi:hypothetical protein GN244_ATG20625 [Phytophthora infestans]|uniref:Myb-like domain-containing protein n=1 Tax=Phytophthora infestans TaxID=4787 RepID=A0A833SSK6_PHYIN|nr:hypothetical protein GN244_ATG20625 [Phytophthora infestans]